MPPRPFWLRFAVVKPIPASGMPASGMPAERDAGERDRRRAGCLPSGAESGPSSSAPRIASTGMSSIGAEAAPACELGSPVIEIEAPVMFALKTVIPLPACVWLPAASRAIAYIVASMVIVFGTCVESKTASYGAVSSTPSE